MMMYDMGEVRRCVEEARREERGAAAERALTVLEHEGYDREGMLAQLVLAAIRKDEP